MPSSTFAARQASRNTCFRPPSAEKGPKHVVKKGKTPVLYAEQARVLLDSIEVITIAGLRDRALIGVMVYSFARIGAVVGMDVGDYYPDGPHATSTEVTLGCRLSAP